MIIAITTNKITIDAYVSRQIISIFVCSIISPSFIASFVSNQFQRFAECITLYVIVKGPL